MIRTGLIGFGLGGATFHAPFISITPDMELTAILQRDVWTGAGQPPAVRYPSTRIVKTTEALLSDTELDLIVISTPNNTHYSLAKAALEAGKHVVVDKPMTATSAEAHELIGLAKSKGLILAPFQNRRFDADFLTVQRILFREGLIGEPVSINSRWDRYRPVARKSIWKEAADPANGLLFDIGPHLIDQALALFPEPLSITASIRYEREQSQIEDAFDITLQYGKLRIHLGASMIAADPPYRFLLHGLYGSFRKEGFDPQEAALVAGERPTTDSAWLHEPESAWGTLTVAPDINEPKKLVTSKVPSEAGDYRLFYRNVAAAIAGKEPLLIPPEQGYRILRVLELARQSSAEGRTLPFSNADWNCM